MTYTVVIEKTGDGYSAYVPDLPGCVAAGDTREETETLIQEAVTHHLEMLRESGEPIPGLHTSVIDDALEEIAERAQQETDGTWLQDLTERVAPHLRDWNVAHCWPWKEWPHRAAVMPEGTPDRDVGIDLVAQRRDDGGWIAIQVKSRKLNPLGEGARVAADELNSFLSAAANADVWSERWLVVNGAVPLGGYSPGKVRMSGAPLKVVNVAQAVEAQRAALTAGRDTDLCPHCEADARGAAASDGSPPAQTRSCMQREAVATAIERLRANEQFDEDGIPRGEARGRIVLPCGTGKTRIALRITEELTYPGELSVVLCPSIALVAQIRREFLQYANRPLRVMAVCSDKGVSADDERIANSADATLDRGLASTEEIKGCPVTTDSDEIADWIRQRRNGAFGEAVSVIFGTYQSAQRVSEAVQRAGAADGFKVLICDEAHRTAGVRRRKRSTAAEERLREFTLCHDRDAFPATYRVYQTATPRIYGDSTVAEATGLGARGDFVVRHMDDQSTFGVELYRRSYADAVRNGWLSDYRIIAMAVGGKEAASIANELVREADERAAQEVENAAQAAAKRGSPAPRRRADRLPSTGDYLKGMGFALAMGGAARTAFGGPVPLRSCIGFVNTIARSKAMTTVLQSEAVRDWVARQAGQPAPDYRLEHLDASSPVAKRDEAKRRLASASPSEPHGVLNVGIFGEGTDSPSLSAVAFLEPRKSPIDVVQAVGRAMRRAEGKELGYIIVPVVIPPGVDAERHLAVSDKQEGWRELGDILQALRAHDTRIEDALPQMLAIQLPHEPPQELPLKTAVAVGRPDAKELEYAVVTGSRDQAEDTVRAAAREGRPLLSFGNAEPFDERRWEELADQPTSLIVHVKRPDGSTETREDSVVRHKPQPNGQQPPVNERQTKRRAGRVAKGERGRTLPDPAERDRRRAEREASRQAALEEHVQGMLLDLSQQVGETITMNLLEKSGLTGNKVQRDMNLLGDAVGEATRLLRDEQGLAAALDAHFEQGNLAPPREGKPRADGTTIAALLWMNAAMLHQRIHAGGWLAGSGIRALADIKSSPEPQRLFSRSWNAITRQDFLPVIEPAIEALEAASDTDRLGGLRRALRHLAEQAEQLAEAYADMGTDHAGALFNKVMGDQSSDGAFFTRPVAADLAARLTLEAADPGNALDWSDPDVWRQHKTVDLACGSGTLLTAVMTEMKRRAALYGADSARLAELQKVAVEETMKGLDINPVSLQLAATQLMTGNTDVKYRKMGLHLMPYGLQPDGTVAAGSPELFGRRSITGRLIDDAADSKRVETGAAPEGPQMDDAHDAVRDAQIVIMNPPFTNRTKMGEKFDKTVQQALRRRMDTLEDSLQRADPHLSEILDRNSLRPLFAALADLCLDRTHGVFSTVLPTIALTATSGLPERIELARRFHVHTILTHMGALDVNLSQGTDPKMNESIVVMRRSSAPSPTRIVSLDRFPRDEADANQLLDALNVVGSSGSLAGGWGEVSAWPSERIQAGDWSAVAWRSPQLADAAARFAERADLVEVQAQRQRDRETERQRDRETERQRDRETERQRDRETERQRDRETERQRDRETERQRDRETERVYESARPDRPSAPATADRSGASDGPRHSSDALRRLPRGSEPTSHVAVHATGQTMRDDYNKQPASGSDPFPVLQSKGADGQQRIEAEPDAWWEWTREGDPPILAKAGHLLVTMGQNTSTARLTAVASDSRYVGQGWMPVTGLDAMQAKAAAVFLNSTPGRLLVMRRPGKSLLFPFYNPAVWRSLPSPDLSDQHVCSVLADSWEATRYEIVPQFRDGYTDIRRRWDAAVCGALGWDVVEIAELGSLLAQEPAVRGVAYGEWKS